MTTVIIMIIGGLGCFLIGFFLCGLFTIGRETDYERQIGLLTSRIKEINKVTQDIVEELPRILN